MDLEGVTVVDPGVSLLLGGAVKVGMACRTLAGGVFVPVIFKLRGTGPALASNFVRLSGVVVVVVVVVVAAVAVVEDVDAESPVLLLTVLTLGLDLPVGSELSRELSSLLENEEPVTSDFVGLPDSEPSTVCLFSDFFDSPVLSVEPETLLLRRRNASCVVLVDIQIYPYRDCSSQTWPRLDAGRPW